MPILNTDVSAYRDGLLAGTWTPDDSRRMLSLSSDPAAVMAAMKEANQDPAVAKALSEMLKKSGQGDDETPGSALDSLSELREVVAAALEMAQALPDPGKAADLLQQALDAVEDLEADAAGDGDQGAAGSDATATEPEASKESGAVSPAAKISAAAKARRGG